MCLSRFGHDLAITPLLKRRIAHHLPGIEEKWRAALAELPRYRCDRGIADPHVEDGGRNSILFYGGERVRNRAAPADDFRARVLQNLFQFHQQNSVVLYQKQADSFERLVKTMFDPRPHFALA